MRHTRFVHSRSFLLDGVTYVYCRLVDSRGLLNYQAVLDRNPADSAKRFADAIAIAIALPSGTPRLSNAFAISIAFSRSSGSMLRIDVG